MSSLSRELVFLILQFLEEEKFKESVHKLEKESGFYFNMKYFEEKVQAGEWDEVEKYLSGFTKVDDNRYSMKIFFEIRKQKYLEALDRQDKAKAVEILVTDLKVFSTFNEELYKEITQLLTLSNFRENEQLSKYGDTKTARSIMLIELKKLIEANPLFRDKLTFPSLKSSRLRTLINQSLNWQHQLCKNPRPNPDIKTLFTDHTCMPPGGPLAPTPVNLPVAAVAKPTSYTSLGAHNPFPPTAAPANASALAGWMTNPTSSSIQASVVTASSIPLAQNQVSVLKHSRTPPTNPVMVDYQGPEHDQLLKRLRPTPSIEEVTYSTSRQQTWSVDDLPRTVAVTLHQGSTVISMDFHPTQQTLLLVGSSNGEITLWELAMRDRLVSKPFKIWDMASLPFQASIVKDVPVSVSRVAWSPDGKFAGAAFTKHLIQLYTYAGSNELRQHLQIDAHVGGVNDLAFAHPNKQLCVVTCGDDKIIKVWDLSGRKLFNFEGHEAPVYSLCPHHKENIQFIFSTAIDGKIKAWLYDNMGSRVDYDAPGHWCTTMLYSADGSRLFSCGTSKEGDSFLVEWNESEGTIKRTYVGFRKKSAGIVQFDTTQNHFLAVGEDSQIKFWDMDNNNVLTSTDAEGGLAILPRLRFSKDGNLLAVTTADNGFKILTNAVGHRSLRAVENPPFEALRGPIESAVKVSANSAVSSLSPVNCKVERSSPVRPSPIINGVDPASRSMEKPRTVDDVIDKAKPWQLTEIVDSGQCRLVTLPESTDSSCKVVRLLYTNSGVGILALGSNGVQKLWKWPRNEQNPSGKATASVVPQHWLPSSGLPMINDVSGGNLEEVVPCIALSKNDSYVMSATGGKVSLFNMMTFKVMTTFMPPPPAPTFLAFHPQDNNIIAIGMEDSTIHIYNVRVDEVKSKLRGHQKRITGLAFSTSLNILVSSGADAELCVWSIDTWEKRKSIAIQIPAGKAPNGDTRVHFHIDQIRMLVVHETQLAIYDASKMERIRQWVPQDVLSAPISCATYSCYSQLVYATFCDGSIGVFDADTLRLRCHIGPTAYMSPAVLNGSQAVYPLVIAAHPVEPNQFAVGLIDGSVKVLEPSESEGKWGVSPPLDNGILSRTTSSSTTSNHTPDQIQR
ncbi:topless-related protein 3-like isoform X1 [Mangifera indica]|uniref:topless-related protein 3-like isoform X1 n=1 Tax=Mangifera indica TaxID=29780 RepID=UPI001CFB4A7A|nr:topless-related protein 3-like isoform X1 [Mangifera indica]